MRVCRCAGYVDRFRRPSLLQRLLYTRCCGFHMGQWQINLPTMHDKCNSIIWTPGWLYDITAQARDSVADNSGFVFKDGFIVGTGSAYLGRAYRPYARVLFRRMKMANVIVPQGWSAWEYVGKE
ncbi:hypothetical protein HRI_004785700 [Hibiscus trionum]|uniref:pectinesterase n=1 Tax=Hibiscus trionum TaxID=183268 RepID=A0A9W7JAU1_HIBTR|nr:hypothetical protein HRI_004785700 [Hibiscus trionum]